MSYLYVSDQSAVISYSANRFQVKYKDGMLKSIPAEMLEVIEVFGNVQITTQCLRECLQRGINVIYYSTKGAYFGRVISPGHRAFKIYLKKLEEKFRSDNKYLSYVDYSVSFRKALDLQVNQLAKMMETGDLTLYKPVKIR